MLEQVHIWLHDEFVFGLNKKINMPAKQKMDSAMRFIISYMLIISSHF